MEFWSALAFAFACCWRLGSYEGAISVVALFFAMDWYLHPARLLATLFHLAALLSLWVGAGNLFDFTPPRSIYTICVGRFFPEFRVREAVISSGYLTNVAYPAPGFGHFNRMAVFMAAIIGGQIPIWELVTDYLIVLAAEAFSILCLRRFPLVTLGVFWYLLAFAPMSNVLGFRNGPYCDSYIAMASIGIAIVFAAILRALWPLKMTGISRVVVILVITLLIGSRVAAAFEAAAWSDTWNDPVVAYEHTLHTFPQAFDAMTELANLYEARGEYRKADELAEESMKIAPDRAGPYAVRAVVAEQEGRTQDALKWLAIYCNYTSSATWALTFEGDIYANHLGQPDRAEVFYQQALARQPWPQDALRAAYELAYIQVKQGHRAEAISLWEKLLVYNPDDSVLHWDLATAYKQQGDQERAAYHLRFVQSVAQQQPSIQPANEKKSQ